MHSEQISASQLLGAFIGSESDKISQSIGRSDFAGELKKLIKEPAGKTGELSRNASSNPQNLNIFDTGSTGEQAASEAKTHGQSASRRTQKASIDADMKAKELKSKAKAAAPAKP